MKSPKFGDAKIMGMNSLSHLQKWGIIVGLTAIYWISAAWLIQLYGDGIVMLAAIPIIMAGWFLGMLGGVTASLLAIILTAILLIDYGGHTWEYIFYGGYPFGSIIFIPSTSHNHHRLCYPFSTIGRNCLLSSAVIFG